MTTTYAGRCLWCRREIGTGHSWPCPYARPRPPRLLLMLVGLLVLACPAWAEVRITGTTTVPRDGLVKLKAEGLTEGAGLIWRASPRKGVSRATTDQALFEFAAPPGVYEVDLIAVRLKDGKTLVEEATATVTIGLAPPVPPPPGPAPPPVPPTDPLSKAISAAYALETDAGRVGQLAYLAMVYHAAGPLVDASTSANDLFGKLSTAIHAPGAGLPAGALPKVSRAVGDFLNGELGMAPAAALDRVKAKAALARVADALGGIR